MNRKLGQIMAAAGATAGVGAAAFGGVQAAQHGDAPAPGTPGNRPAAVVQQDSKPHASVGSDERALLARDGYSYSPAKTAGAADGTFNWDGTPGGTRVNPGTGMTEHAPPLGASREVVGSGPAGFETVVHPAFAQHGGKTVRYDGRTFTVVDVSRQQAAS